MRCTTLVPALLLAFVVVGCGGAHPAPSASDPPAESTEPSGATVPSATVTPATPAPTSAPRVTSPPDPSVPATSSPVWAPGELVEWTAWTASNWVHDLAVDDDAIWAATDGGLVRWDRATRTAATLSPLPGDPDVRIWSMDVAGSGEVWVGMCGRMPTSGPLPCGVARLDPAGWTVWRGDAGLIGEQSFHVAAGPGGSAWAGGASGLSRFDGGSWSPVAVDLPSSEIRSLAVAADGTVWAGTWAGLVSIPPGGDARTWTSRSVESIACTDDGVVWFGTWDPGRQAGGLWRISAAGDVELVGLEDHQIWSLASVGDAVYAATSIIPSAFWRDPVPMTGPLVWHAGADGVEPVPGPWDEVSPYQLLAVAAEPGDGAWFGGIDGFWSVDGDRFVVDGPGPWPVTIDATVDGVAAAGWIGASWFDGTSWTPVQGDTSGPVDVLATPDGTAWIGTGGGLVRVRDGVATDIPVDPAGEPWSSYLPDTGGEGDEQLRWDLELGPDGTVWATAGSGGLWDLTHGVRYTAADGLPSDDIQHVAVDADGLVCVSDGRIACGRNGTWSIVEDVPGAVRIVAIAAGGPGSLWALGATSTGDALLARRGDHRWLTYPDVEATAGLTADDGGAVWFGIHRGAARFDGQTVTELQLPRVSSERRDDRDVARVVEIAPDGTLWILDGEVLYRSTSVTADGARYGDRPLEPKATIGRGDRGDSVAYLQRVLHDRADALGVESDGILGPMTERAVRRLQLAGGLEVDGIVGPRTWALVDALAVGP